MPTALDFLFIALIVVVVPLRAYAERRRLEHALASGATEARVRAYRRILAWQWTVVVVLIGVWLGTGRPLRFLGIAPPQGVGFIGGAAFVVLGTLLLLAQLRAVRRSSKVAEQVRATAASLTFLLPSNPQELRLFTRLGITAGIVEELLCRGYMMWVIAAVTPTWIALILTSIAFGVGHAYQGVPGVLKTSAAGLVFGGLYLVTGSIWAPIVLHAVVDVLSGKTAYEALQTGRQEVPN